MEGDTMSTWDEARWLADHDIVQEATLELRARVYATAAHAAVGQLRKYTGEPYIKHPEAVAELVRAVPHTEAMLAAAWLHDVVEDTKVTDADLREEFGPEVAELVRWLTDVSAPQDGNRAARKRMDLIHLADAPAGAQTVKVADLIDNASTIVEFDPHFARVFLAEKAALLTVLTKADATLLAHAHRVVAAGIDRLNEKLGNDFLQVLRGYDDTV
jgi:(p)ppGpp synthase/HD superfamily hydrolase